MANLKKKVSNISILGLPDSVVSMFFGAIVVLLVAVLAYNYFRVNKSVSPDIPSVNEGELTNPASTVNLPTTHIVEEGETLWSLAEFYYNDGYSWNQIAVKNELTDPDNIEVGMKLIIPKIETFTTYTVVSGDSLWNISLKLYGDGYRWTQIAQLNHLSNPSLIHSGNVLRVPR